MSAPTDLELMMYFDGELEEPRRTEVRKYVESSTSQASQKLAGLQLVSGVVREHALFTAGESAKSRARAGDTGITDAVMAKVRATPEAKNPTKHVEPERSTAPSANASGSPSAKQAPRSLKVGLEKAASPANDNGRLIFAIAGFAAAAAAALFIWGRTPDGVPSRSTANEDTVADVASAPEALQIERERVAEVTPPAPTTAAPTTAAPVEPTPALAENEDAPPSVEVAAVDFGSRPGAIYYVSGDNKPTATTVVWVRDE